MDEEFASSLPRLACPPCVPTAILVPALVLARRQVGEPTRFGAEWMLVGALIVPRG